MPDDQDSHLISPPPRDLILSLRRDALERTNAARSRQKAETAHNIYDYTLRKFAEKYFFDSKVYDALKPKEKNELAEIYAFFCRKKIALKTLPFTVIAGIITGFGIWDPTTLVISFFSLLILFVSGGMCFVVSEDEGFIHNFIKRFKDCWDFLSAKRFLKRLVGREGIFEEQKNGQ